MSSKTLTIRREHTLGLDEARRRVDKVAEQLGGRLNLVSEWEGDYLRVTGQGVTGHIEVAEEVVEITVRMGFAMMIFREPIRSAIEGSIDEYIA